MFRGVRFSAGVAVFSLLLVTAVLPAAGGQVDTPVTGSPPATGSTPANAPRPLPSPAFAAVGGIGTPDTVLIDVVLSPAGDAHWEILYRVRLEDDNETAAFESLARDVRTNGSAYERRFADRIDGTVSAAENATGRDMAVRDVSVRTTRQEIPQRYGALIYSFTWTGFATTDGSQIQAGDAISGFFLDETTSLTIHWPEGYGVVSVDPEPDEAGEQSATWRGPADFTTDQPRLAVSSEAAGGSDGMEGESDSTGGEFGDAGNGTPTTLLVVGALVVLAILASAGWWWYRRQPAGSGSGSSSGAITPGSERSVDQSETDPPEDLLSNEERVLRLLREHGGRMKQQQVVQELGWTDAKTSQVVGALRETGEIEAFRLGRENVLDLPEDGEDLLER